jgi:hypothetical protein
MSHQRLAVWLPVISITCSVSETFIKCLSGAHAYPSIQPT